MLSNKAFYLSAGWPSNPQTLGQFVEATTAYLRRLQSLHPLFGGPLFLTGSNPKEFEELASDLSNLDSFVRRYGWDRKAPADWHTGVMANHTMSRQGTSRTGFRVSINSSGKSLKPNALAIMVTEGCTDREQGVGVEIDFPEQGHLEFTDYTFVRSLFEEVVSYWRPYLARVTQMEFRKAQVSAGLTFETIGWMNYFANPAVQSALPSDVQCEPFGPGGALLTLQHDLPSAQDPQAVARAQRIRQALLAGNWFSYEMQQPQVTAAAK
jgi:Immunity protein 52